jgi:hypothetical protein
MWRLEVALVVLAGFGAAASSAAADVDRTSATC